MSKKVEKEEEKCVWMMGGPCEGETSFKELFSKQIKVPICELHLKQHTDVMVLAKNGYDVEAILQETPEYRRGEVLVLELAGLTLDKVEI